MACVLSVFRKRPETFPNLLTTSIDFSNEFLSPLFISCVSSANWEMLCSTLFYPDSPFLTVFSSHIIAKISTHNMNKYGDIGSPCLHPRSTPNHYVICYYYRWFYVFINGVYISMYKSRPDMTFAVDWALNNNYLSIHVQKSFPKPKDLRVSNMNPHSSESNAFFSKSRHSSNPGNLLCFQ